MVRPTKNFLICCFLVLIVGSYQLRSGFAASGPHCMALDNQHSEGNGHVEVLIAGGDFSMGSFHGYPEEAPARQTRVEDFWIDVHEVTNGQFARFVEATGYITSAERAPDPELYPDLPANVLVPGSASFIKLDDRPSGQWREWWKFIEGANWRQPKGPGSDIHGMESFPVVHVSYQDAVAYADWVGRELPSEAQWEFAAQSSAKLSEANTWQGFFPLQDKALDGFDGIAPVGCFTADAQGLVDMKGNVWEMVADIFQAEADDPLADSLSPVRVIKGGSYLCADNYCQRDRPQARQGQEENFSTDHVGFRTIARSTAMKAKSVD